MQNDVDDKNAVLASTNTEEPTTQPVQEEATIKASSLQDNLKSVERRDLSAIIPQNAIEGSDASGVLESKEKLLKADGAVVIGNVDNGTLSIVNGVRFPDKIDVEARKKYKQEQEKAKRSVGGKKVKKVLTEEGKKAQNTTTIIVLIVIVILGIFAYYFFNKNTEADFTLKTIDVELGDSLPTKTLDYVNPANVFKIGVFDFSKWFSKNKGSNNVTIDDMEYSLNTSMVKVDEVGEYTYTVTHAGVTKEGTIIISDTKPPELELKEVRLLEGDTYTPQKFVAKCHDLSGCSTSFEDEKMASYTKPGNYEMSIVAIDPYENKDTKKVNLIIESREAIKKYQKVDEYNEELGYSLTTTYEIHLSIGANDKKILDFADLTLVYKYQNRDKYGADFEKNKGDKNYTFDNETPSITKKTKVNMIENLTSANLEDIVEYLTAKGYIEVTE